MGRLDIPPFRREFALLTRFLAAVRRQMITLSEIRSRYLSYS
jgi:hypothetical protein